MKSSELLVHGGVLAARALKSHGVVQVFTLSGGHIFPIYDGCKREGIALVDVRHEATAAFAAEGWAKVTRTPGVCAVTAGPGVTNIISALASAKANGSPLIVLAGRAPTFRWGQGSLQEIDHLPLVEPVTKFACTAASTEEIPELIDAAWRAATTAPFGPAFIDFPLEYLFGQIDEADIPTSVDPARTNFARAESDSREISNDPEDFSQLSASNQQFEEVIRCLSKSTRPVLVAGSEVYWNQAEGELNTLIEKLAIPAVVNGLARGCVPADHPLFCGRARSQAFKEADCVLIVGAAIDFRFNFGAVFSADAEIVVINTAPPEHSPQRAVSAALYNDIGENLNAVTRAVSGPLHTSEWLSHLNEVERVKRADEQVSLTDNSVPIHPLRIYGELQKVRERDAIFVCDGGDFVSFAGRVVDSFEPGAWLDPGPFGCLGCGAGYALAAKLAHPDRQVFILFGDGAFGFSGFEFDTFARHRINVVAIVGNNGIWGLEKHPMEFLYGYSVVADLRAQTRYDKVVEAFGGHAEFVTEPDQLAPALTRAIESNQPALINVITDPQVAYPRSANLA